MTRTEAEALFDLDRTVCETHEGWTSFFVETVTDYIVWQSRPTGLVNGAQAEWLLAQADSGCTLNAFAILVNVLAEADRVPRRSPPPYMAAPPPGPPSPAPFARRARPKSPAPLPTAFFQNEEIFIMPIPATGAVCAAIAQARRIHVGDVLALRHSLLAAGRATREEAESLFALAGRGPARLRPVERVLHRGRSPPASSATRTRPAGRWPRTTRNG